MLKIFLLFSLTVVEVYALSLPLPPIVGNSVVPDDKPYYKYDDTQNNLEYIYTKENVKFAKYIKKIENELHKDYRKFYNWTLDEKLYVGLISNQNQIANGFSTQFPNNRQINYIGGTQYIDYFSSVAWLDTLIYHETAHNYQLNVKRNGISEDLHSVFGNGIVFLPWLIVPNMLENSFMLEGNAVLNESWHGNGGRLYSGRFKALTILQAQAGNITPQYMYNLRNQVTFPYGDTPYIIGGFYNYYMAQKYGLKKINAYFKNNSKEFFWPFFTNRAMQQSVGEDFENSVEKFALHYKMLAKKFVQQKGKSVAHSQFFSSLSSDKKEIYFITNESGKRKPELIIIDKQSKKVTKNRDSWMSGKIIKAPNNRYYTQGSRHTSVTKIEQGLFDNNAFIKKGTAGKMIQGYLRDGREVYFDVAASYVNAQLYVGNKFYTVVHSSVIIDEHDNLYYFKQKGKTRTLYKNKRPLFSYKGFYGIISDVDSKGNVYFIANSKFGSTLYRYTNGKVNRVSAADNIIEARLLNDKTLLIAAISVKDYYYVLAKVVKLDATPFETKLFFEDKKYYNRTLEDVNSSGISSRESYNSLLDMHYSGSDLTLLYDKALYGLFNVKFSDPLTQNALNLFLSRDDTNITIAGITYANARYRLQYSFSAYGVVDKHHRDDTRTGGVIAQASLPVYQAGYYKASLNASYYQDYDTLSREPLTFFLNLNRTEHYGTAMFLNALYDINLYGVKEREDTIVGSIFRYKHSLPLEFYIGAGAKYSVSNAAIDTADAYSKTRGVKVSGIGFISSDDISTINLPTTQHTFYLKSAGYFETELKKTLNFSAYYFTFPLSLQREAVTLKYRHYELEDFNKLREKVNEYMFGIRFDLVLLNSLAPLPLSLNYYYNDNKNITKDTNQLKMFIGFAF